jgi:hypothetical protein
MIRLLLWASNRQSQPIFNLEKSTLTAGTADTVKLTLSSPLPAGAKLETRVRDLLCRDISKATLPINGASAEIKVPALPGGAYLLDTTARDAKGASLGWASFTLNVAVQGAVAVRLDQEVYQPGQPVVVTAETDAVPPGTYTATLRVWDAQDRLLQEKSQPLTDGKASWTFPNSDPLCVLHYADVEVQRNGVPYLASRTDIFVPQYTFTDFRNCLWGGWIPYYATSRVDRRLRENLGFDVILCGGYGGTQRSGNYLHLTSGIMPFYTNVAYVGPQSVETAPVKSKADTQKMVEGSLDELKKFGGTAIFFQDERHGMSDAGKVTEEALGEFRNYLKYRLGARVQRLRGSHACLDQAIQSERGEEHRPLAGMALVGDECDHRYRPRVRETHPPGAGARCLVGAGRYLRPAGTHGPLRWARSSQPGGRLLQRGGSLQRDADECLSELLLRPLLLLGRL